MEQAERCTLRDRPAIAVTPAMIRAGATIIEEYGEEVGAVWLAEEVYLAMAAVQETEA